MRRGDKVRGFGFIIKPRKMSRALPVVLGQGPHVSGIRSIGSWGFRR